MDDQALRDYFEFDEDDLAANRNSEFSARQKQKIASDYKDISKDGLKLGLPTAALAVMPAAGTLIVEHLSLDLGGTRVIDLIDQKLAYKRRP